MYGRAAFSVPFSTSEVHAVSKATSPQTSPAVPLMCEDGRPYVIDSATGRRLCACHLAPEGAHTHLHGGGSLPGGLKSLGSPLGSPMPVGLEAGGFYNNALLRGMMVRQERLAQCLTPTGHPIGFDPTMAGHPYGLLYAGLDVNGLGMRKAATRETTGPLKAWLHEHKKNPYPTKAEKIMLAIITKMTLTQVSTWFANARRRLKKENRLYTGRDNDNEEDVNDKDDDDDNDTDGMSKHLRDTGDSDEDINVDVSDISDNEDDVHTMDTNRIVHPHHHHHHHHSNSNAITTTATTTYTSVNTASPPAVTGTEQKVPLPLSSSMPPFPICTPPFHQPHFIPRPGPMPVFHSVHHGLPGVETARCGGAGTGGGGAAAALHGSDPLCPVIPGRDSGAATGSKVFASGAFSDHPQSLSPKKGLSSPPPSSLSSSSNGVALYPTAAAAAAASVPPAGFVVRAPRPKIWSISQIIHSDTASSSSSSSVSSSSEALPSSLVSNSSSGAESTQQLQSKGDSRMREDVLGAVAPRPDFLHHRLASPFASLETPNGRLPTRHHAASSAFLVQGMHPNWVSSSVGIRLANPCHTTTNSAKGNETGDDCSPEVGETSPGSSGNSGESSLQTEALDLQTKKEEKDDENNTVNT